MHDVHDPAAEAKQNPAWNPQCEKSPARAGLSINIH
jgi:hypothetical protein